MTTQGLRVRLHSSESIYLFPQLISGMTPGPLKIQREREELLAPVDVTGKKIVHQAAHRDSLTSLVSPMEVASLCPACCIVMTSDTTLPKGLAGTMGVATAV
jgi:hypothetical protein